MIRLLFIDDDPGAQQTLAAALGDRFQIVPALSAAEGLVGLREVEPDVVLLDIDLPDRDGLDLLEEIVSGVQAPPVIMLTAFSQVDFVKRAIQSGACDYLVKPFTLRQLEGTVRKAVQNGRPGLSLAQEDQEALRALVGDSAPMRELRETICRYAAAEAPVLILGQSGTGKELVARAIHLLSPRCDGPFVPVNCGALPETLIETELFGSERGAYTDAVPRAGCFERAGGGTIFLDEIAEMAPRAQVTLLRVLEEKEVCRVGGARAVRLNVRVISATNRELKEEVRRGRFREDLYYRIEVLPLSVPPLRERAEDIPLLAAHFLRLYGGPDKRIRPAAVERLSGHPWPGNVRELRNVMQRAVVLSGGGEVSERHLRWG